MTAGDLVGVSLSIHEIIWTVRYLIDLVPEKCDLDRAKEESLASAILKAKVSHPLFPLLARKRPLLAHNRPLLALITPQVFQCEVIPV